MPLSSGRITGEVGKKQVGVQQEKNRQEAGGVVSWRSSKSVERPKLSNSPSSPLL